MVHVKPVMTNIPGLHKPGRQSRVLSGSRICSSLKPFRTSQRKTQKWFPEMFFCTIINLEESLGPSMAYFVQVSYTQPHGKLAGASTSSNKLDQCIVHQDYYGMLQAIIALKFTQSANIDDKNFHQYDKKSAQWPACCAVNNNKLCFLTVHHQRPVWLFKSRKMPSCLPCLPSYAFDLWVDIFLVKVKNKESYQTWLKLAS